MSTREADDDDSTVYSKEPEDYENVIPVSPMEVNITIRMNHIYSILEPMFGRELTLKERREVRYLFEQYVASDHFNHCGMGGYNSSDTYKAYFQPGIEEIVQKYIQECYEEIESLENMFEEFFIGDAIKELIAKAKGQNSHPITWETIDNFTKKQIQDENEKNGLARCENEVKAKSILKWKKNFIRNQIPNEFLSTIVKPEREDAFLQMMMNFIDESY